MKPGLYVTIGERDISGMVTRVVLVPPRPEVRSAAVVASGLCPPVAFMAKIAAEQSRRLFRLAVEADAATRALDSLCERLIDTARMERRVLDLLAKQYRRETGRRPPGSLRTKRLRKKRTARLYEWGGRRRRDKESQ